MTRLQQLFEEWAAHKGLSLAKNEEGIYIHPATQLASASWLGAVAATLDIMKPQGDAMQLLTIAFVQAANILQGINFDVQPERPKWNQKCAADFSRPPEHLNCRSVVVESFDKIEARVADLLNLFKKPENPT